MAAVLLVPACASVDSWSGSAAVVSKPAPLPPASPRNPAPVVRPGGPPPHAPAHGYRHKHARHNVDLQYDAGLGVYLVLGHDGLFFHADYYYRQGGAGVWHVSAVMNGPWVVATDKRLPPGLKKHGKEKKRDNVKGKKDSKGKGHGKGKG